MRHPVAILGVPIDDLDTEQALARLDEFVQLGRFHQVATANTDFLIKAAQDPELMAILRRADFVVPDGMPLVAASRWLGTPLPERVTGADLVPRMAELAARKGYGLYMLGAKPEVAAAARRKMEADNPGLRVVGQVSPPLAPLAEMDHESILRDIEATKPDILLVAFGNPKQEKWIHMHRRRLRVPVCIGVGGTFDFIAGNISRAPQWMQRSGLEWLYRFSQEPGRLWKRYAVDIGQFATRIQAQLRAMRPPAGVPPARVSARREGDAVILEVEGALAGASVTEFQRAANDAVETPAHLVIDLSGATALDARAVGALIYLPKRAAFTGREVRIAGASGRALRALRAGGVESSVPCHPRVVDSMGTLPRDPGADARPAGFEESR